MTTRGLPVIVAKNRRGPMEECQPDPTGRVRARRVADVGVVSASEVTRRPSPFGVLCRPRIVVVRPAERPPLLMLNRYPGQVIGIAVRLPKRRQLSILWAKPSRWWA